MIDDFGTESEYVLEPKICMHDKDKGCHNGSISFEFRTNLMKQIEKERTYYAGYNKVENGVNGNMWI